MTIAFSGVGSWRIFSVESRELWENCGIILSGEMWSRFPSITKKIS
jgi:hypothetical protein